MNQTPRTLADLIGDLVSTIAHRMGTVSWLLVAFLIVALLAAGFYAGLIAFGGWLLSWLM